MAKLKVYVTGGSGLVGSRFLELAADRYLLAAPVYPLLNLVKKIDVRRVILEFNPDVVVHFAAFTDVSAAQSQIHDHTGSCWQINVTGTQNLLDALPRQTYFIYISTDMVFPGSVQDPGPYPEDHPACNDPDQLTWYGYTKSVAEKLIPPNSAVIRINYPVRTYFPGKLDFLRKSLDLFDKHQLYPLFTDQQISISDIDTLCRVIDILIKNRYQGILHCASENTGTPYDMVSYVLKKARHVSDVVHGSAIPVNNRYPKYGGLSVKKSEHRLGIKFGSWQQIIDRLVRQGMVI